MPRRILTKAAVVAMRSIAGGGFVCNPKHARHLREVAARAPRLITISPAVFDDQARAPGAYFRAELTQDGVAFIGRTGPGRHRKPHDEARA
jgi:hypothetical protein